MSVIAKKEPRLETYTPMYIKHPEKGYWMEHFFPYAKGSSQLQQYIDRGYQYEVPPELLKPKEVKVEEPEPAQAEPVEEAPAEQPIEVGGVTCPECGFTAKSMFGLNSHIRAKHKKE